MFATLLLLVSLGQDSATPAPFLWRIEGMGDAKRLTLVTVSVTPIGLASGIEVKTISLDPRPTRADTKQRAIRPVKTERAPFGVLQAWFKPPARRFHLIVTLSNGSTHKIDIYRKPSDADKSRSYTVTPQKLIAPRGTWTRHCFSHLTTGGV